MDSLLSIVQMPAGIPVGTLAIGKAGAVNAALLAAAMLATSDDALAARLRSGAKTGRDRSPKPPNNGSAPGAPIGIIGGGQLGRMLGIAAAKLGFIATCRPDERPCATDVAAALTRAAFDDVEALAASASRSMSRPTSSRICRSRRWKVLDDKLRPGTRRSPSRRTGRAKSFIEAWRAGRPVARGRRASPMSTARSPRSGSRWSSRPAARL